MLYNLVIRDHDEGMNYFCSLNGNLLKINGQKMLTIHKSIATLKLCLNICQEKVPMSYENIPMNHRPN